MSMFRKATKEKAKLRLALAGPPKQGKTYSSLSIAQHFGKVALIDTEHGSASKYADLFEFDVVEPDSYDPRFIVRAIEEAADAGYEVLVIDSLSHFWNGKGGTQQIVDETAASSRSGSKFNAWAVGTPIQDSMVHAIMSAPLHIIATMRSKMEYALEKDPSSGKTKPVKVGLAPVQRNGIEYEFDMLGSLEGGTLYFGETRCTAVSSRSFHHPGEEFASLLLEWLTDGAEPRITDQEARDAFTAMKAKGFGKPQLQQLVHGMFEVSSLRDLTGSQRDALLAVEDAPSNVTEFPESEAPGEPGSGAVNG